MIVEFIGLPGSGKTTMRSRLMSSFVNVEESRYLSVERAYLEVAKDKIDPIFRRPLKVLPRRIATNLCLRMSQRSVRHAEAQVEFLAKYGAALGAFTGSETYRKMSEVDRKRVISSFLGTGSFWQFLNVPQMSDRVVLFGEGLVQKSFMFVDHAQSVVADESRVIEYLENIPRPDLLVYVQATIDESSGRMAKRPDGLTQRLKQADDRTIRRFLQSGQAHLDLVVSWLTERRPNILIAIANHDDSADAIDELRSSIEAL